MSDDVWRTVRVHRDGYDYESDWNEALRSYSWVQWGDSRNADDDLEDWRIEIEDGVWFSWSDVGGNGNNCTNIKEEGTPLPANWEVL